MKKTILFILAAFLMIGSASAQTAQKSVPSQSQNTPNPTMNQEVNLMAGIRGSMERGTSVAPVYGGYYSAYNNKGLGFRAGFEMSPGSDDMAKYYGVPVQFLWKYGYQRSVASALKSGVSNAAYSTVRSVLYGQKPDLERTFDNFILGLLQNFQVFAGITPSVLGRDVPFETIGDVHEPKAINNSFGMSADLGLGMSFYAGPLEIGIVPAFHYMLAGNALHEDQSSRLYYSTMINVGLIF